MNISLSAFFGAITFGMLLLTIDPSLSIPKLISAGFVAVSFIGFTLLSIKEK